MNIDIDTLDLAPAAAPKAQGLPASPKQQKFILSLLSERETTGTAYAGWEPDWTKSSVSSAKLVIIYLVTLPYKKAAASSEPGVSVDGLDLTVLAQYACQGIVRFGVPGGDTRLKVQVSIVASGRWAGWVFVKDAAVYGEGQRYGKQQPGRTYEGHIQESLRAILADPKAAMKRYAELTDTCGRCGLPLEDEKSVARGVGPICAGKMGW